MLSIIAFVLLAGWLWSARHSRRQLFTTFSLDPHAYRLLGTDLGGRKPLYLRLGVLRGAPDAAFVSKTNKHGVIGEYKSRRYRGFVRWRERYQCLLYMGMFKEQHNLTRVCAVLRFADQCVEIDFDEDMFHRLVGLCPEFQCARKRWRAPNHMPRHKRVA